MFSVRLYLWKGVDWKSKICEVGTSIAGQPLALKRLEGGKPVFHPRCGLHFNITNTTGVDIAAMAAEEVGVDAERINRKVSSERIAKRYFQKREVDWLMQKTPGSPAYGARFFVLWTAKEAAVKLDGRGLYSGGLCACELEISEDRITGATVDGNKMFLQSVLLPHDLLVTVAAYGDFRLALPEEFPIVQAEQCHFRI